MRHFNNIHEMYYEVQRDLKEMGIKYVSETVQDQKVNKNTLELHSYAYSLTSFEGQMALIRELDINPNWLETELADRTTLGLEYKNPGYAFGERIDFWNQFIRDGVFAYTYAERLHPQIPHVLRELRLRSNTRQAVLTMYDQHQDIMNFGGRDRIPCSMYYQLLYRNDKLHMNYTMRSCDFIKFFIADVILARGLQIWFCNQLKCNSGTFTHFIGSLHAFEEDLEGVF